MKSLKKLFSILIFLSIINSSFAQTSSLSGEQVFDYFSDFIHEKPSLNFIQDPNISYSEFLNYFYQSFEIEFKQYSARKMYKLVKNINYRSKNAKFLYQAISDNLIQIQNNSFDFEQSISSDELLKFKSYLTINSFENLKQSDQSIDYYENFLLEVYDTINQKYYFHDEISKQKLVYGAINGMIETLEDPHSSFQTPEQKKDFLDSLNQELEGIGASMTLNENKQFQVITPLKGSPALKAGLLPGDIVISVNGIEITGKTLQEGIALIKGPSGTKVKLTIKRNNKYIDFYITRAKIEIPIVSGKILENQNLLIDIRSFGDDTYKEIQSLLNQYNNLEIKNIIIDLRSNPGGYLHSAIQIADLFINNGQEIVSTKKYNGTANTVLASNENVIQKNIYIMVNKGTASASEILILALQNHSNVKIYGEKTYGKGSLQEMINFSDDSALKLTTGMWFGPNNVSINNVGILPDVIVELTPQDVLNDNDPVLNKILIDIK